ncbi:MAG: heat-inducible transcriptional repressor HrcA [Nitriliruptorales bacterium]
MSTDAQTPEHGSEQAEPGLDARKAAVLTAIVREYVQTAEPVGSKRIVDAYELGVSAATVRNEMSALEESGHIAQPHTSAGRVPTDKGYRYFVDALDVVRPVGTADRLAVEGYLERANDLEDLLRRSSQVLARLTHYASLVLAPAIDRSRLKLLELVQLSQQVAMVLLIADTGRVVKRIVELPPGCTEVDVQRARTVLNESAVGLRMADVPAAVAGLADGAPAELRGLLGEIASSVDIDLGRPVVDRVFVGGQAALAGEGSFETKDLRRVFELLEEEETLGRVLAESATLDRPLIRIGEENEPIQLRTASIVATGYGDDPPGSLGVLGPTRMDYPTVLAVVRAVAEHLQATLRSLTEVPPDG